MLGMEMMLSNMIGMKPDELQSEVKRVLAAIHNAAEMMQSIDKRLSCIEESLNKTEEPKTNGRRKLTIAADNGDCIQL